MKALLPDSGVCVMGWAKLGVVRHITLLEAPAEELIKSPTSKKPRPQFLIADAHAATADVEKAKKSFEAAALEVQVCFPAQGPIKLKPGHQTVP